MWGETYLPIGDSLSAMTQDTRTSAEDNLTRCTPVKFLSKLNKSFFGYFDPKTIFYR